MRFNNRSRGLLLVKFRLAKGRLHGRASFLPLNRRRRHVAEMQTGFFTVEVRHNFRRQNEQKPFSIGNSNTAAVLRAPVVLLSKRSDGRECWWAYFEWITSRDGGLENLRAKDVSIIGGDIDGG
jgi:hypothetical protein